MRGCLCYKVAAAAVAMVPRRKQLAGMTSDVIGFIDGISTT